MSPHEFLIVVPVAERPRHLRSCLDSLRAALRRFPYAGRIRVLIAEDSADAASCAAHLGIVREFAAAGVEAIYFPPSEQAALARTAALPRVLGAPPPTEHGRYGHKGQGVMRNIAYLKASALLRGPAEARTLIWSIDSDQEFRVNIAADDGYAIDYFNQIDALFRQTEAQMLTGKVVGDPPVSPAVMTQNFLADVLAFLADMSASDPAEPCRQHAAQTDAAVAYHDMADLFGFTPPARQTYPCPLSGAHSEADCCDSFSGRANSFFYGEHPTRHTAYQASDLFASVQAARTVYTGNTVFRPAALAYFIPFAPLRLRMSGPTLGRILKAELGARFICANLPMLHKRTVTCGGKAEFRPGIEMNEACIDISDEYERQFYGDVMLFAVEQLCAEGGLANTGLHAATIDAVHRTLLKRYNANRQAILDMLATLDAALADRGRWWHAHVAGLRQFAANVRHNFGDAARGPTHINDTARRAAWRARLLDALAHYTEDRAAWMQRL